MAPMTVTQKQKRKKGNTANTNFIPIEIYVYWLNKVNVPELSFLAQTTYMVEIVYYSLSAK